VTGIALLAQATLMYIVALMAAITISLCILELLRQMALLTCHRHMQSHQWKCGQVVIEADISTPIFSGMALIAFRTQLT